MTSTRTASIFDEFADRDDYLGFGYIGGRRNALDGSDSESPAQPELVADMDGRILARARRLGWSDEQLFTWANSKNGRWFADMTFGGWTSHMIAAYEGNATARKLAAIELWDDAERLVEITW